MNAFGTIGFGESIGMIKVRDCFQAESSVIWAGLRHNVMEMPDMFIDETDDYLK